MLRIFFCKDSSHGNRIANQLLKPIAASGALLRLSFSLGCDTKSHS
jgi:hypothetical protein